MLTHILYANVVMIIQHGARARCRRAVRPRLLHTLASIYIRDAPRLGARYAQQAATTHAQHAKHAAVGRETVPRQQHGISFAGKSIWLRGVRGGGAFACRCLPHGCPFGPAPQIDAGARAQYTIRYAYSQCGGGGGGVRRANIASGTREHGRACFA